MTGSELQCTNVLIDYFFKEFVYKNLYVYDGKQKKELCDGLVEFQDAYVIFQIKEKDGSTTQDWLHKKVYKKAVSQIKDTIDMIRNLGEIEVESFSGEKITLVSTKQIMPVIIFDSDDNDYKQVHVSSQNNALRINVFSMNDFVRMLDSIAIPYDIVYYLELRTSFFEAVIDSRVTVNDNFSFVHFVPFQLMSKQKKCFCLSPPINKSISKKAAYYVQPEILFLLCLVFYTGRFSNQFRCIF